MNGSSARQMSSLLSLTDQVRTVLETAQVAISASEIFERLPCRDSLLADVSGAYERAITTVSDVLLRELGSQIRFDVIEGNDLDLALDDMTMKTYVGIVTVYRLAEQTDRF